MSRNAIAAASGWIFGRRRALLILFVVVSIALAFSASRLRVDAGFTKMIPLQHEYMQTFLKYQDSFGGANKVLVAVRNNRGDIYDRAFMETLRKVAEEVFYLPGVERSSVLSLFNPNVRYAEVVEDGFRGGTIVDAAFTGTPQQLEVVRANLLKSDWVGRIVSNDMTAAMVVADLQDDDSAAPGQRLDLRRVAQQLEGIRAKYETGDVSLHIIGFAKVVGDIAAGAESVALLFALSVAITALLLYAYSGSWMLTAWALVCALVPVVWLLGLLPLLGLGIDPLSILVPFLIFAIGVSHAVQMTHAWKLEAIAGADGLAASRASFEKLFVPGAMALLANALGFMVIAFVDIRVVRELALTATLGVTVMIVTNKVLLPILLSYMRLSHAQVRKLGARERAGGDRWRRIGALAGRRHAPIALLLGGALLAAGLWKAGSLQIGDLGAGVPELRADSRYNRDVAAITAAFAISVDELKVIAETADKESACIDRAVLDKAEAFEFEMRQTDGVASVQGLAGFVKQVTQGYAEGSIKWRMLPEEPQQIAQGVGFASRLGNTFMNSRCTALPISVYTRDHKAATLEHVIAQIKSFKAANDGEAVTFRLASGNLGIVAATNEAVAAADKWVNLALFVAVSVLCLLTFRSVAATLCIVIPLATGTVLCNALMAALDIGVKVNTLPVVALGVGVGMDYGIYLFERMKHAMQATGCSVQEAFVEALRQRGAASVFTALTMAISVGTWTLSPLKFQADMGLLLAFMFLVNVLGAIFLLPALAAVLVRDRAPVEPAPHAAVRS